MSDDEAIKTHRADPGLWTVIGLPLSSLRAHALAEALSAYEARCIEVKKALDLSDGGAAYKRAQELKHAEWSKVFSVVEHCLAHIAVHAR